MTPEQYAARQAAISASIASFVYGLGRLIATPALAVTEWVNFLASIFPEVVRARTESAQLAREFYDSQRQIHIPTLPRNDRPLEGSDFRSFVRSMEPARPRVSQEDATDGAVANVALRAVRAVENAGRRQIINAVEDDPELDQLIEEEAVQKRDIRSLTKGLKLVPAEPRIVKGWARIATGRETCAWCLMLISRGPKYHGAEGAGLDLDDESAAEMFAEAGEDLEKFYEATSDYMEEWHEGCDCKVVPVFKVEEWPGKAAQDRALELWIEASKEATRLIESGEARSRNHNKEAQNALRRRLERGDLSMSEFSALAA